MPELFEVKTRGHPRFFKGYLPINQSIALFESAGYSAVEMNDITDDTGLKIGTIDNLAV